MEAVFLKLFNMSIAASFMILAVVLLRALFKKAPKALRPVLWALVGIRLICPFSLESALSLIPSAQTIPDSVLSEPSFSVQTGFEGVDTRVNAELASRYYEGVTVPANTGLHITSLLTVIWVIGIFALAIYAAVSFIKLRRQTAESIKYAENIYLCDRILSVYSRDCEAAHLSALVYKRSGYPLCTRARKSAFKAARPFVEADWVCAVEHILVQSPHLDCLYFALP